MAPDGPEPPAPSSIGDTMNFIRTLAAAALFTTGFAHAAEITDFPQPGASTVSRAEVQAEAEDANRAGALRHDFIGPVQKPMSVKSRDDVRQETVQRLARGMTTGSPIVGGM
jgi:hypothetical protein